MPQKKNPDSLELIRGKAGRVFGHHTALLSTLKGLPLAYNKDMQEDKEALFDTIDTLEGSLNVMTTVLRNITINESRMREAATSGYLNATDLADYLVRKGLEFRKAHEVVGRVVMHSMETRKRLDEVPLEDLRRFSPLFDADCYQSIELGSSLESKRVAGGTSPEQVANRLAEAWAEVSRDS